VKRLSALLIFLSLTLPVAHTQASSGDVAASDRLAPALPLSPQTVDEIDSLMATPPFDQGVWGLEVRDLATGKRLLAINRHRQFQAASTTKNFTTAATLDALGRNHRFRTPVTHTGRITRSGTLHGNLVLVASGDLTMGGREKPDGTVDYTGFDHTDSNEVPGPATLTPQNPLRGLNDLARQVKRSGIDRVRKDIVIDDRLWQQTLVNHEEISPIIINDNVIDITMTPTSPGQRVAGGSRPPTGG
jgi:D-alanyl-D-alanine carboxypeptidase/D-alanyl-D-alanine-endopeptidase (penicillin-binding protein 4)